jgi:CRP/FNR family transcriptional regulator
MSKFIRVSDDISKERAATAACKNDLCPLTDELDRISRYKSGDRIVKAGCDLFSQGQRGDAIYRLVSGWAALYNLTDDGRRQILQFSLPGAVLAFLPAPGAMMNYSAQALTDVVVCVIPHVDLARLSNANPEFGMQMASLISQDRGLAYDNLSSMGQHSARERVAHLLLELFIRYRMRWPGQRSEEMHLPLTQEQIGDATGLTGVHVNRVLQALREEGIVEFHYRRLRILNPDKLVDIVGVDPHVALSWMNDEASGETPIQRQARGDRRTPVRLDAVSTLAVVVG